jgi:hypothetical protein
VQACAHTNSKEPLVTRTIAAVLLVPALAVAVACGSGDKKPQAGSSPTSAALIPISTAGSESPVTAPPSSATRAPAGQGDSAAVGDIFSTVLGGAFGGGASGPSAAKASDPTLGRFLPGDSDLPAGFVVFNQITSRVPDGITTAGGMDMAASMAMSGDPSSGDPASLSILMSMVLRPDDLTALGKLLGSLGTLNDASLKKSLEDAGGSFAGITIKDVHVLDASGLGEGGAGLSMTMDMSGYISKLGGAAPAGLSVMTMHMYLFGRGDYIGGVIRIGFSDTLAGGVDELGLAKLIDRKLQAG